MMYHPSRAENPTSKSRYAFWKTEDEADFVPQFDDEGVREEVLAAWKLDKARPDAEARAEELAELVRTSGKSMSTALAGQTVTGKEGSPAVTTQLTGQFTWLTQSSAPSTDPFNQPPPDLSSIPGIDELDTKFMEYVFDKLQDGEVGSVPNRTRSIYYAVQVVDRQPATSTDENAQRLAFLQESPRFQGGMFGSTAYSYSTSQEQSRIVRAWINNKMGAEYQVNIFPRDTKGSQEAPR
jgi:hypothetical protein